MRDTQTTRGERPRKRLRKRFIIPVVILALGVGGPFAWRAYSQQVQKRAVDELRAEVLDTKNEFPLLRDVPSVAAARVRGTNGWDEFKKAFDLADSIRKRTITVPLPDGASFEEDGEFVLSAIRSDADDLPINPTLPPAQGPAKIAEALRLTEPMAAHFKHAVEAQCIVMVPTIDGIPVVPFLGSWKVMCGRIGALLDAGRAAQARNEIIVLLEVAARMRTDSFAVGAQTGARMRQSVLADALLGNLERLPMPTELLRKAVAQFRGRQPSFLHTSEGDLAYVLYILRDPLEIRVAFTELMDWEPKTDLMTKVLGLIEQSDPAWANDLAIFAETLKTWIQRRRLQVRELRRQDIDARDAADIQRFLDIGECTGRCAYFDPSGWYWQLAHRVVQQDMLALECELRLLELQDGALAGQKAAVEAAAAKVKGVRLEWDGETLQLWYDDEYEIIIKAEEAGAEEPFRELKPLSAD